MRILIVTATYSPSINGVALTLELQKKELEKRGHQITVLAPKHPNQTEEAGIIRIPSLPNPLTPDYPIILPIPTIHNLKILAKKYDIVYFHHPLYIGDLALNLAKYFNCPAVFFYHSRYEKTAQFYIPKLLKFLLLPLLIKRSVRILANKSSHLIVETPSIKKLLERQKIKTEITVIRSAGRSMLFNTKTKSELRKKYGLRKNDLIILCVARLSKEKNLTSLLRIFSQLKSNITVTLVLTGDGPEKKNLKKLAQNLKIYDQCRFLGSVENELLPEIYSLADIFAYPCKMDTQAIVILEAMSAGLPIIAFNSPGPKDFINNNQNGYLVNSNNGFSNKLNLLIENENLCLKLGHEALSNSKKYSLRDSIDSLERLFKEVI